MVSLLKLVLSAVISVTTLLSEKIFFVMEILFESLIVWEIPLPISVDEVRCIAKNKTKKISDRISENKPKGSSHKSNQPVFFICWRWFADVIDGWQKLVGVCYSNKTGVVNFIRNLCYFFILIKMPPKLTKVADC